MSDFLVSALKAVVVAAVEAIAKVVSTAFDSQGPTSK